MPHITVCSVASDKNRIVSAIANGSVILSHWSLTQVMTLVVTLAMCSLIEYVVIHHSDTSKTRPK